MAARLRPTLPSALDSEHQKMLDELKAKNGKDFDRATIRSSSRRTGMRSRSSTLTPKAATIELKGWAGKTLPHLKEHLSMAEKLK